MDKEISDKFVGYIIKQEGETNKICDKITSVIRLKNNYESLMNLSDDKFRLNSLKERNSVEGDLAYKNISAAYPLENAYFNIKYLNKNNKLDKAVLDLLESIQDRKMRKEEYNYYANNSPEIIREKLINDIAVDELKEEDKK